MRSDINAAPLNPHGDPDIALVMEYLAGALDANAEAKFERRLVEDEAFFDKVFPIIRAWRQPQGHRDGDRDGQLESGRPRGRVGWLGPLVALAALIVVVAEAPRLGVRFASRRPLPILASGATVATGPVETREIMLEDSTRVVLRPRTTLAYSRAVSAGAAAIARIRGEAVFEISHAESALTVETSAGLTSLGVGRYAIRCAEGAREMLVTVERGTALLRGMSSALDEWLTLDAGQFGRVRDDTGPSREDGRGFPQVASSAR